ncbi:2' O-ribose methyltransferase [Lodderomyces elongisporus]|uniref:2' O-ribose methyltransferase n=1 Tax=Lodderomyces elongisporus TaxID=36914 RepID=UPI00291C7AD3|nr:2' O-ribose methyltransferase [Lodderomyces elongisporus]WLF78632.1 2' O-ribose methyltransferase [Lodderomyces elongisporus]
MTLVLDNMIQRTYQLHPSQFGLVLRRFKSKQTRKHLAKVQDDPFNRRKGDFYRSRAAFKILEINDRCRLFHKNCKNIVDLGFAPGAWTQVAVEKLHEQKIEDFKILGIDINEAVPYRGCHYIQGDLLKKETHEKIKEFFKSKDGSPEQIDLIMSDMMVNCTGHEHYDHLGNMELCGAATILSFDTLKTGGNLVMKVWHGSEEKLLDLRMRIMFERLVRMKPESSRSESSELFYVGLRKRDLQKLGITLPDLFNTQEELELLLKRL